MRKYLSSGRPIVLGALLPAILLLLGARQQTDEGLQVALERGTRAYQQGDFTTAIEAFDAALAIQPESVRARFNLARALHQAGDVERALQELLQIEGRVKDQARYLTVLGQVQAARGSLAEAEVALREAAKLRPGVARTQYWLGEVLALRGKQLDAIESMTEAARLNPGWAVPHKRMGEIWLRLGAPGRAIENLEKAFELAPEVPNVLVPLGTAYATASRHEDAVRVFEKAIEKMPEATVVRALLADSLLAAAEVERAVAEYRRVVEQASENTRYLTELAEALYLNEQLDEALSELERVLAREPQNGLALYYVGAIEEERGHHDIARARLEAAVATLEDQSARVDFRAGRSGESYSLQIAARVKLADLLSESQEYEAVVKLLETVVRAEPDHATAHYLLGLAYRSLGKRKEAQSELALFKQINDAREFDQAALIALQRGDEQRAVEDFQQALGIYPADSVAHRHLARLTLKQGKPEAAIEHLEQAIEARPSLVEAYTELMRLYCRFQHLDRARSLLERAQKEGMVVPGVCVDG